MNILMIGDVVGGNGSKHLRNILPKLKREMGIDVVVANGENSSDGNGITPASARFLFDSGVDVITTGNHTYRRPEIYDYLDMTDTCIRPANFPVGAPGYGVCVLDMGRTQVCVINIIGQIYMDSFDSPFDVIDEILDDPDLPKIKLVDFHAEATGEKRAFGYYLDGRVTAVVGTHTHVQTADECILPEGTAYISDVGMTGCIESVLGVKKELVIRKCKTKLPVRFDYEQGPSKMDCVLIKADDKTGKALSIERLSLR
ncbi:MAG: TIGR00282 family metallophosphoesterase [Clostridia bacterium]|nr:TIGR00282 family metallophosphoesterase [Clostridia bacterium]